MNLPTICIARTRQDYHYLAHGTPLLYARSMDDAMAQVGHIPGAMIIHGEVDHVPDRPGVSPPGDATIIVLGEGYTKHWIYNRDWYKVRVDNPSEVCAYIQVTPGHTGRHVAYMPRSGAIARIPREITSVKVTPYADTEACIVTRTPILDMENVVKAIDDGQWPNYSMVMITDHVPYLYGDIIVQVNDRLRYTPGHIAHRVAALVGTDRDIVGVLDPGTRLLMEGTMAWKTGADARGKIGYFEPCRILDYEQQ